MPQRYVYEEDATESFDNRQELLNYQPPKKELVPQHHYLVEERPEKRTGPLLAAIASAERPPKFPEDDYSEVCSPTMIHGKKKVNITGREIEDELKLYSSTAEDKKYDIRSNFSLKKSLLDKLNASGNSLLSSYGRTGGAGRQRQDNKIIENIKENLSYLNMSN